MWLINDIANALGKYNEFTIILTLLPFLAVECKKNCKSVSVAFFTLFLLYAMFVLVKGALRIPHPVYTHTYAFPSGHCCIVPAAAYAFFKCLLKDKKRYLKWTLFVVVVKVAISLIGGYHDVKDCAGGVACLVVFLAIIELYIKRMNYIKLIFGYVFVISVVLLVHKLAPTYCIVTIHALVEFGLATLILWVYPDLKRYYNKRKDILKKQKH